MAEWSKALAPTAALLLHFCSTSTTYLYSADGMCSSLEKLFSSSKDQPTAIWELSEHVNACVDWKSITSDASTCISSKYQLYRSFLSDFGSFRLGRLWFTLQLENSKVYSPWLRLGVRSPTHDVARPSMARHVVELLGFRELRFCSCSKLHKYLVLGWGMRCGFTGSRQQEQGYSFVHDILGYRSWNH
jgi:hypothetical protein